MEGEQSYVGDMYVGMLNLQTLTDQEESIS
jgi:hypothetical protein